MRERDAERETEGAREREMQRERREAVGGGRDKEHYRDG